MIKNNDRCSGMCSNMQRISRRDFIKVAIVAGAGLVTACTPIPTEMPTGETLADSYIASCGTSYCLACPEYKSTCAGCLAGQDEKVSDTAINCVVRTCSRERNLANCAFCEEYVCNKLEDLYAQYGGMAAARATLDEIHQSLP